MAKFKQVLLIEDDAITIMLCERILRLNNFAETIITKQNGQEAIEFIQELIQYNKPIPEICFLDINMPIMNGWDFLNEFEKIKMQLGTPMQIYILSSTANPEDFIKATTFKTVTGTLPKPLCKEHLIEMNFS
ncbi:MAG TPA: response regulator [Chitinophagaceae bacterium]|nr:response regulator [Chitinophagaceae bacterium]MCC6634565.1 response regulator [Chitinophagaceae bacterium]HMZ46578.1 response regulator [Chitinophagaceae bacterium]HNE94021.1 response regulator [Chitinophagaceae bacterium]HNJ58875.1 response regulator [Chitinophagaceae bacterium]